MIQPVHLVLIKDFLTFLKLDFFSVAKDAGDVGEDASGNGATVEQQPGRCVLI